MRAGMFWRGEGVWGPAGWSLSDSLSCSAAQQGVMRKHAPHIVSSRDGEKTHVWLWITYRKGVVWGWVSSENIDRWERGGGERCDKITFNAYSNISIVFLLYSVMHLSVIGHNMKMFISLFVSARILIFKLILVISFGSFNRISLENVLKLNYFMFWRIGGKFQWICMKTSWSMKVHPKLNPQEPDRTKTYKWDPMHSYKFAKM